MGDANRRIRRVHALSTGPARAERVDPQVLGIDMNVHFFGLRQYRDGGGGGVNPAARLGRRDALDSMHAALVLQAAVDPAPFDCRRHFLGASSAAFAEVQDIYAPALPLRVS